MDKDQKESIEGKIGPLSILELLNALWAGRKTVIGGTLACAIVAVIISLILPETYESSATILLVPPPFREAQVEDEGLIGLFPKMLNVRDYSILLRSDGVLMSVIEKLKEQGTWPEEDLEDLAKPSKLRKKMYIRTTVNTKTAYATEYSPAVVLTARGPTPELAREMAETWAEVAEEKAKEIYKTGKGALGEFMDEQFKKIQSELSRVFELQRDVERAWDAETAKRRILEKTILLSTLESNWAITKVDLEGTREEAEELRASVEGLQEQATIVLKKSPPMEALFTAEYLAGSSSSSGIPGEDKTFEGYEEEVLNPTYLYAEKALVDAETKLKGLEERERTLTETIATVEQEREGLREENAKYNYETKHLLREETAYAKSYDLLAAKVEQAKIAEAESNDENLGDLKIVAHAVVPDKKIAPRRSLIVASAALLALIVSSFSAVLRYRLFRVAESSISE